MRDYIRTVQEGLNLRTKLEALAEESAELSQAALKLIRAMGLNWNFTTTSEQEAEDNLLEELYDVLSVCMVLGMDIPTEEEVARYWKWKRWAERLTVKPMDAKEGE